MFPRGRSQRVQLLGRLDIYPEFVNVGEEGKMVMCAHACRAALMNLTDPGTYSVTLGPMGSCVYVHTCMYKGQGTVAAHFSCTVSKGLGH